MVSSSSSLGSHGEAVDADKSWERERSQLEDKVCLVVDEALTMNKGFVVLVLVALVEAVRMGI